MHLNTFKYCTYYLCIYWKFKDDIASLNHCSLELLIYFSCQIVFVTLPILLSQAKMWVRLYFLPHVAFAECLVHSDVADSESAFFPLWTGFAHIFKVSHIHPLQPLSAEVCIGIRLWIRPLGDASCVQISNFTGYDQICASCFELVSNREAKVQKSGFSSCHLWVGLDCREVKMILAWNSKSKPFSSYFGSDAKLPKSF